VLTRQLLSGNEVHVKIKLVRSRNSFCLMSADELKVNVENAIMFVRKVKLSPSVFLADAKALENATAKSHMSLCV